MGYCLIMRVSERETFVTRKIIIGLCNIKKEYKKKTLFRKS